MISYFFKNKYSCVLMVLEGTFVPLKMPKHNLKNLYFLHFLLLLHL